MQKFFLGIEGSQSSKKVEVFRQPNQNFRASVESGMGSFTFTSLEQRRIEQSKKKLGRPLVSSGSRIGS